MTFALSRPRLTTVLLAAALLIAVPSARTYHRLCGGPPLDTYPILATARDEALRQSQVATTGAPSLQQRLAATVQRLRAQAADSVIAVKHVDLLAFAAHAVAGWSLEAGGCPAGASADQWRKAVYHADADWMAAVAIDGLTRTLGPDQGRALLLTTIDHVRTDEPWHLANAERVSAYYLSHNNS